VEEGVEVRESLELRVEEEVDRAVEYAESEEVRAERGGEGCFHGSARLRAARYALAGQG
jgi:hypothetical protein